MESLTEKLLVAIPELPDSNFSRSVVLILEHNEQGAMGVILNRPSNVTVSEYLSQQDSSVKLTIAGNIHVGGPVEGPVLSLHNQFSLSDPAIIDEVYLASDGERLMQLVNRDTELSGTDLKLKVFQGYSGWAPGQLDMEIDNGGWLVADARADDVFCQPDFLWKSICERVGNDIMLRRIPNLRVGGDPGLN